MNNIAILLLAAPIVQSCFPNAKPNEQSTDESAYVINYQKDGHAIGQEIKDTFLISELERMQVEGANYKPREEQTEEIKDAQGRLLIKRASLTEQDLFGLSYTKYSYDGSGNLVKQEHLNTKDQWVNDLYGIAVEEHKYDSRNNCIESRFFDKDHNPAVRDMGPHRVEAFYNEKNQNTQVLFLDVNGVALPNLARIDYRYDRQGKLIEEIHYNGQGKAIKKEQ